MKLSGSQIQKLKEYLDARIAEKIEEAFGRDSLNEGIRCRKIEDELDQELVGEDVL